MIILTNWCINLLTFVQFIPTVVDLFTGKKIQDKVTNRCMKHDKKQPNPLADVKLFYASQVAERTKVHVYLPYRVAISFYVYIVPLGLIRIFLYVQISCGLLPTRFCLYFPIKLFLSKKVKF